VDARASADGVLTGRREGLALAAIVLVGALLQASRLPFRWNAISIAYASYFKEYLHTLEVEGPAAGFTTFVGLHPPAYSLLFVAMVSLGVAPLMWHLVSGLLSVAAVPAVFVAGRAGWRDAGPGAGVAALAAAAVLAVSPHRNAYGLEPNNYPLLVLATGLQWAACSAGGAEGPGRRRRDVAYGAATVLALLTHVLALALPAAQLITLLLHPRGRERLKRFALVQGAAAVPCLALLPALIEGSGAPPINDAAGVGAALRAVVIGFPTRYASGFGAAAMGAALAFGAWRIVAGDAGRRAIAPLGWVVHGGLVIGLIGWMVAMGIAADHQFPYYLAAVPSGALIVGSAVRPGAGLLRSLAIGAVAVGLLAHVATQGLAYAAAAERWGDAATSRSLVAHAVAEWPVGGALLLVQFPQFGDDDKDYVDPAWAHIPIDAACRFEHPGVPQLVTADPYAGQPVLLGGRWLYTFTQFDPERIDPIVRHHRDAGQRVVIAMTETEFSPGEVAAAERWVSTYPGLLGKRAPGQVMWVIDPPR